MSGAVRRRLPIGPPRRAPGAPKQVICGAWHVVRANRPDPPPSPREPEPDPEDRARIGMLVTFVAAFLGVGLLMLVPMMSGVFGPPALPRPIAVPAAPPPVAGPGGASSSSVALSGDAYAQVVRIDRMGKLIRRGELGRATDELGVLIREAGGNPSSRRVILERAVAPVRDLVALHPPARAVLEGRRDEVKAELPTLAPPALLDALHEWALLHRMLDDVDRARRRLREMAADDANLAVEIRFEPSARALLEDE